MQKSSQSLLYEHPFSGVFLFIVMVLHYLGLKYLWFLNENYTDLFPDL